MAHTHQELRIDPNGKDTTNTNNRAELASVVLWLEEMTPANSNTSKRYCRRLGEPDTTMNPPATTPYCCRDFQIGYWFGKSFHVHHISIDTTFKWHSS